MYSTILDRLAQRVPLKTDTEESRLACKMRKAFSHIKNKQTGNKSKSKPRGGLISMGARGVYVKDSDIYSRRVIVKARYIQNKGDGYKERIRTHLDYITRFDAGLDGKKPELFSDDDFSNTNKDIVNKFEDSPHNFRFIISPEDGEKLDIKSFTKDLIKKIEKDLKTKLEWIAAAHYDTNEPHVHVVINGNDKFGKKLLLTRDYISHGIRSRAAENITKKLGLRKIEDVKNSLSIEAENNKKCYLDEIIKTNVKNGYVNSSDIKSEDLGSSLEKLVVKRLFHLQKYGLSSQVPDNKWHIKEDYLKDLYQINRTHYIIEKISIKLDVAKEKCEIISTKDLSEKSVSGLVVSRCHVNEIEDDEYLIIKTDQQKHIYVELEKYSEKIKVKVGELVRLELTKAFEGPKSSDRNIYEVAQAYGGTYEASAHEKIAHTKKKLPPGVSAQEFVQVHLKRLELMARIGFAEKINDKTYTVSPDFLEQITEKAQISSKKYQPHIKVIRISKPELTIKPLAIDQRLKP